MKIWLLHIIFFLALSFYHAEKIKITKVETKGSDCEFSYEVWRNDNKQPDKNKKVVGSECDKVKWNNACSKVDSGTNPDGKTFDEVKEAHCPIPNNISNKKEVDQRRRRRKRHYRKRHSGHHHLTI